jgi:hypothetical protein
MKPKFFISLFLVISTLSISLVRVSAITTEQPFGGMWSYTLNAAVCDCNYANVHLILDYRLMTEISLYRAPQSIFYSYYNGSGLYQLGTYGTNTQDCMMWIYEGFSASCETIWYNDFDYGSMPGTGTTLL